MVSTLEGRWLLEDENGDTTIALISVSGEVKFVEDPETEMRVEASGGEAADFLLFSGDELLCQAKLMETEEGPTLQLEGEDGHSETWRKVREEAPKTVSRKKGAIPRIFTKEGQQGSGPSPPPPPPEGAGDHVETATQG
mmetsp:Transcript_41541/g.77268  ORF Transcript_41541/g.77268 Transcript_41541/m.77268 type:complete len:139 (-) Transcript_41541:84-500(-)